MGTCSGSAGTSRGSASICSNARGSLASSKPIALIVVSATRFKCRDQALDRLGQCRSVVHVQIRHHAFLHTLFREPRCVAGDFQGSVLRSEAKLACHATERSLVRVQRGPTTALHYGPRMRHRTRRSRPLHRDERHPRCRFPRMRRNRTDTGCKAANPWSPATAPRQAPCCPPPTGWLSERGDAKQRENAVRTSALAVIGCVAIQRRIFRGAGDPLLGPALPQTRRCRRNVEVRIAQLLFQRVQHRVIEQRPPFSLNSDSTALLGACAA